MAVEISGSYAGNLNVDVVHGPSGTRAVTAAPADNQGDGSSFSPTDMVAAALGACMLTIMGIVARRHEIDLSAATFRLEKHMSSEPRRIASVPVEFHLPKSLTDDQRIRLERAALTCPVYRSLHPEVEKEVRFVYDR